MGSGDHILLKTECQGKGGFLPDNRLLLRNIFGAESKSDQLFQGKFTRFYAQVTAKPTRFQFEAQIQAAGKFCNKKKDSSETADNTKRRFYPGELEVQNVAPSLDKS